jgi:hypothetical protein
VSATPTINVTNLNSIPDATEDARARAKRYLERTGNADLLPVLGLADEQRACHRRSRSQAWLKVQCPTCGVRAGSNCRASGKSGSMTRPHVARQKAAVSGG